jgi:hypothetical protein
LNLSFAAIVRRCDYLRQVRVFRPKYLRRFQGFAQELQAEMNQEFLETLNGIELDHEYRYGKVRQRKSPDQFRLMVAMKTSAVRASFSSTSSRRSFFFRGLRRLGG